MSRESEILQTKRLGEEIGYGNMMHLAERLWRERLEVSGLLCQLLGTVRVYGPP